MTYLFMDESGDLGFKISAQKSSRYFIVALLCVETKKMYEKIILNAHRRLRKKYRLRSGVIHAAEQEPKTILKILKRLATHHECKIMIIYLDKKNVSSEYQSKKHDLYNLLVRMLLKRCLIKEFIPKDEAVIMIASQRETNHYLNNKFISTIVENREPAMNILIKKPFQEKLLQLVDIVCWAIARKYEHHDNNYCAVIEHLIVEEDQIIP